MKTIVITFTLIFSLTLLQAQQIKGIATYKTDRKVDLKMDSTMVTNDDIRTQIAKQLRDQFRKEYTLTFNNSESLYEEVEKLAAPSPASSGGISIVVTGGSDLLYRNTSANKYANQTEISGKEFLIQDTLEKPDWKLENETKYIGQYRCFKATYTREVKEETFNSASDSIVKVKKDRVTTAWYTLDIPLAHGPDEYWGLPGLILQIEEGDLTVLCSKIVLNPEKEIVIDAPKNGKKVTQMEFDEIQEKKNKEMMERFKSDGRRKDGKSNSFSIKVGG